VVSDGDEGDEAKGKHREVLLRFDGNVVAIRVSAMNDREGRERPSRTVDCQTLYVSCEGGWEGPHDP
jgi:hypothetical protein